ncbi:hypothetical protein HPB48_009056 [Haemaphysalis longicornis]|uniref:Uncharacterized protein n=1 Tax=Haemaphysalis longicornis TaxID=44386 RepID=A0A9J6G946_HAELO|nr:hypothetical protein HPB48_009056 [Haemaphysalis longicornis]
MYVAATMPPTTGVLQSAASVGVPTITRAEELAIPLAITDPQCTTVPSDSKTAILHYARKLCVCGSCSYPSWCVSQ